MKKIILMAAAGLVLSGCSNNEPAGTQQNENNPIAFTAPVIGKATRATEITDAYPTDQTFGVWAIWHAGDYTAYNANNYYMGTADAAVEVKYEGTLPSVDNNKGTGGWASAENYYWPKENKLTFAAYSPFSATGDATTVAYSAKGLGITDFAIKDEPTAQYDLLYSDRSYNRTATLNQYEGDAPNTYAGVDIVFHHALSAIHFTAKTQEDYGTYGEGKAAKAMVTIKSVTVKNVKNKGTFDQGIDETSTDEGSLNTSNPAWTVSSVDTDKRDYTAQGTDLDLTATAKDLTNTMILLPQEFSTEDAVIEVKYTVQGVECTKTMALKGMTDGKWEINKRYTYNIIIALNKIYFAPVVEGWDDVTAFDVNM